MRDFRDAKAMAQSLRESLTAKAVTISHSESLEIVSRMLGAADWNTLSARIQAKRPESGGPAPPSPESSARYPALPVRDFVVFPTMTTVLFVGREKTKQALDQAFRRHREVVLAVQKDPAVDQPAAGDVYGVGVLARVMDLMTLPDGSLKVVVYGHRRVAIRGFAGEAGLFEADVADISEGPIPEAGALIHRVVERFQAYADDRQLSLPQTWPVLAEIRDPGRVADVVAQILAAPVGDKQALLETLDPVARLEKVAALLEAEPAPA